MCEAEDENLVRQHAIFPFYSNITFICICLILNANKPMKHPFWLTECFLQHYMQSWHVNLNYEFVVTVIGKGLVVEAIH